MTSSMSASSSEKTMTIIVHVLNLAALLVGISSLVALVLAYVKKGETGRESWAFSHYVYAIRTFWIGLLYSVISLALMFVLIGFALIFAVAIWWIVRVVVALVKATKEEPIANPRSWLV